MVASRSPVDAVEGAAAPVAHVFGPRGRQLFGVYHPPAPSVARGVGVVLCNPLGYEAMCAHRTYRHLAQRLAMAGFHALRFDYHGTGDSSGGTTEAGRLNAWIESIRTAMTQLRACMGDGRLALFGVRFGGTLATLAAAQGDVDALVLWAPSPVGRAYVRELRAFRSLRQTELSPGDPGSDGTEEFAGHLFDTTTLYDLASVDLHALQTRVASRALVAPRAHREVGVLRLVQHLESVGVQAVQAQLDGYDGMLQDPQFTQVPHGALDAIVSWLEGVYAASPSAVSPPWSPRRALFTTGAHGRRVREEAQTFGSDGRLVGILTEPEGITPAPSRPAVLFLNVGANHRVGPHRMYVTFARDLAERGFLSLRFDLGGLGDSARPDGPSENQLYSTASTSDVVAAMDAMRDKRGVDRFVLVGVCSGAYAAFHTVLRDPRVVGQVLVNLQTFDWRASDSLALSVRKSHRSTRYYLRAPFQGRVWARALRGQLDSSLVAGALWERASSRVTQRLEALRSRVMGEPPPATQVELRFRELGDRGVDSLCIYGASDGGLDVIEHHLGVDACRMRGRRNFHLEIVEGADHTFTPKGAQREFHDRLVEWLVRTYGGRDGT
jgi:pimeloyl-ACP methyl ester carboxylesterase